MRLAGGLEVIGHAEVEVDAGADEPAAAALRERLGLGHFPQSQQRAVEVAGLSLAVGRDGELDVVDPGQPCLAVAGGTVDRTDEVGNRCTDAAERVDGTSRVARDLE